MDEAREKFADLLDAHRRILYKVSNLYCRNADDREDLTQEIAVQLWRSYSSFDERCRFSTWMYRVAINTAISFARREGTRAKHIVSTDERLLNVAGPVREPDELRLLHDFIDRLAPLDKALILLYLDGNSYREISEVLGITETNASTRVNRLRQTMKNELR